MGELLQSMMSVAGQGEGEQWDGKWWRSKKVQDPE
jgi:hypothetical protein